MKENKLLVWPFGRGSEEEKRNLQSVVSSLIGQKGRVSFVFREGSKKILQERKRVTRVFLVVSRLHYMSFLVSQSCKAIL